MILAEVGTLGKLFAIFAVIIIGFILWGIANDIRMPRKSKKD